MLAALDGSCRTPIAGLAELDGHRLMLKGCLLNGRQQRDPGHREATSPDAEALGLSWAERCGTEPGPGFLARQPGTVFGWASAPRRLCARPILAEGAVIDPEHIQPPVTTNMLPVKPYWCVLFELTRASTCFRVGAE